jgi:hypothetical protein
MRVFEGLWVLGLGCLVGGWGHVRGMRNGGMEHEIGGLRNGLMAAMAAMMSYLRLSVDAGGE